MKCFAGTWLLLLALATGSLDTDVRGETPPQADKETVVKGNNAFALDLYAQLRGQQGNLFLSPYSISTALAMTYAGARGPTAEQMAKTLHFWPDQDRLHPTFAAVNRDIMGSGHARDYQLYTANALWAQTGKTFLPDFIQSVRRYYSAELQQLDFQHAAEEARRTINAWVEKQTQDKIKELLKPGMIDSATRLVLTNAIYFKGNWVSPFKKDRTQNDTFQITAGQKVPVSMMHQTEKFRFLDGKEFQVLEMPYAGDALAMDVLLPRKVDGLTEFEQTLSLDKLTGWLGKLHKVEVQVAVPKVQLTAEFQLNEALARMGMPVAFRPEADFSGMDGRRDLFLSAVVHKAFVDVNEEGTEAAAATGAVITLAAAPVQRVIFRADHPFLFLIRDTRSGSILFMGRLTNPVK